MSSSRRKTAAASTEKENTKNVPVSRETRSSSKIERSSSLKNEPEYVEPEKKEKPRTTAVASTEKENTKNAPISRDTRSSSKIERSSSLKKEPEHVEPKKTEKPRTRAAKKVVEEKVEQIIIKPAEKAVKNNNNNKNQNQQKQGDNKKQPEPKKQALVVVKKEAQKPVEAPKPIEEDDEIVEHDYVEQLIAIPVEQKNYCTIIKTITKIIESNCIGLQSKFFKFTEFYQSIDAIIIKNKVEDQSHVTELVSLFSPLTKLFIAIFKLPTFNFTAKTGLVFKLLQTSRNLQSLLYDSKKSTKSMHITTISDLFSFLSTFEVQLHSPDIPAIFLESLRLLEEFSTLLSDEELLKFIDDNNNPLITSNSSIFAYNYHSFFVTLSVLALRRVSLYLPNAIKDGKESKNWDLIEELCTIAEYWYTQSDVSNNSKCAEFPLSKFFLSCYEIRNEYLKNCDVLSKESAFALRSTLLPKIESLLSKIIIIDSITHLVASEYVSDAQIMSTLKALAKINFQSKQDIIVNYSYEPSASQIPTHATAYLKYVELKMEDAKNKNLPNILSLLSLYYNLTITLFKRGNFRSSIFCIESACSYSEYSIKWFTENNKAEDATKIAEKLQAYKSTLMTCKKKISLMIGELVTAIQSELKKKAPKIATLKNYLKLFVSKKFEFSNLFHESIFPLNFLDISLDKKGVTVLDRTVHKELLEYELRMESAFMNDLLSNSCYDQNCLSMTYKSQNRIIEYLLSQYFVEVPTQSNAFIDFCFEKGNLLLHRTQLLRFDPDYPLYQRIRQDNSILELPLNSSQNSSTERQKSIFAQVRASINESVQYYSNGLEHLKKGKKIPENKVLSFYLKLSITLNWHGIIFWELGYSAKDSFQSALRYTQLLLERLSSTNVPNENILDSDDEEDDDSVDPGYLIVEKNRKKFDVEELYEVLQTLSSACKVLGEEKLQIQSNSLCLQLIQKIYYFTTLNGKCLDSGKEEDKKQEEYILRLICEYSSLGLSYHRLGYSGDLCEKYFSKSNELISMINTLSFNINSYFEASSTYFMQVENIQKTKESMTKLSTLLENQKETDGLERILRIGVYKSLYSNFLLLNNAPIKDIIKESYQALELKKKALNQLYSVKPSLSSVSTVWKFAFEVLESYEQLGRLCELKGDDIEAESYYRKGYSTGNFFNLPKVKATFLFHLSEIDYKRHDWAKTEKRLTDLQATIATFNKRGGTGNTPTKNQVDNAMGNDDAKLRFEVMMYIRFGDLKLKQCEIHSASPLVDFDFEKTLAEAMDYYRQAEELINTIISSIQEDTKMKKGLLNNTNNLQSPFQTVRNSFFSPTNRKLVNLKDSKKSNNSDDESTEECSTDEELEDDDDCPTTPKMDNSSESTDSDNYITFDKLRANIKYKFSKIEILKKNYKVAESFVFKAISNHYNDYTQRSSYLYTLGSILLSQVEDKNYIVRCSHILVQLSSSSNDSLKVASTPVITSTSKLRKCQTAPSSSSLTIRATKKTQTTKKSNDKSKEYEHLIEKARFNLLKAFLLCKSFTPSKLYSQICKTLGLLESDPILASYFFNESINVTIRHRCNNNINKELKSQNNNINNEFKCESMIDFTKLDLFDEDCSKLLKYIQPLADNYYHSLKKKLPSNALINTITFIPERDVLVVSQLHAKRTPLIIAIEVPSTQCSEVIDKFDNIIKLSNQTMSIKVHKEWSDKRWELDTQLEAFLDADLQKKLFGHWKGLFLGVPRDSVNENMSKFAEMICDNLTNSIKVENKSLLLNLIHFYIKTYPYSSEVDRNKLLKDIFQDNTKLMAQFEIQFSSLSLPNLLKKYTKNPIMLILDGHLQKLPFESMPILYNHPASRLPSIHFYLSSSKLIGENITVNTSNLYYIINPSNDVNLKGTEERFAQSFANQKGWQGIINQIPSKLEMKRALQNYDIFQYSGHGSSEKYFDRREAEKLSVSAVSLLMGCSSGLLKRTGDYDPNGYALSLLCAGSPAVVGFLFDVTDKDCDSMSASLLGQWIKKSDFCPVLFPDGISIPEYSSLLDCIPGARNTCRLKYLNGAALVYYGVPIYSKEKKK